MGAINYKTNDYITMGLKPYSVQEIIDGIKSGDVDYDAGVDYDGDADTYEQQLYDYASQVVLEMYEDDESNAESILNNYDFDYFEVSLENGYYEGFYIDFRTNFDFYSNEDKDQAKKEADQIKNMFLELAGIGFVACYIGWGTGYEDYDGTVKMINKAYDEIVKAIENEPLTESKRLMEASSVYSAKLSQFLAGQPDEVVKWVKKVLNNIFLGIKADFEGYQEGKRPTIKSYGTYKIFKMTIQAVSDVKKNSNDVRGKWNFHDPVKDYCSSLGKIIDKKIDGDNYQCVFYNHTIDLDSIHSWSEHDKATSQSDYPMVGCYSTGIGGSYKNLSKEIPGTTYSIIVSIPLPEADKQEFSNPFMTKHGDTSYSFANDHHSQADGKDTFTVEYGMHDGEFVIREYTEGSADRFTIIYKGRNHMKAFKALVSDFNDDTSVAEVEQMLTANGLRVKHSWWFNPYTD